MHYYIAIFILFIICVLCLGFVVASYQSTMRVPKVNGVNDWKNSEHVIHRSWYSREMNQYMYEGAYKSWIDLNPTYSMVWHNDDDCEQFMKEFGEKEYNAWKKLIPTSYKSDLWRACLLYTYGGVYVDSYAVPYVGIDDMLNMANMKKNMFISVIDNLFDKHGIHNGFMIANKGNLILRKYIDNIVKNVEIGIENKMLEMTGPICLNNTLVGLNKRQPKVGLNKGKYNYFLLDNAGDVDFTVMCNGAKILHKKYDFLDCYLYQKAYKFMTGNKNNYHSAFLSGKVCN